MRFFKRKKGYKVVIYPDGSWNVQCVFGNNTVPTIVNSGHADNMDIAEEMANEWIAERLRELEDQQAYRDNRRIYTVPIR